MEKSIIFTIIFSSFSGHVISNFGKLEEHQELVRSIFRETESIVFIGNISKNSEDYFGVINKIFQSKNLNPKSIVVYTLQARNLLLESYLHHKREGDLWETHCRKLHGKMLQSLRNIVTVDQLWSHYQYSGFIVNSNWSYLESTLNNLVWPPIHPILYALDSNDLQESDLELKFQSLWNSKRIFKLHIYLNNTIYSFNPFHYDSTKQKYGKLLKNDFLDKLPSNFNGAPINAEMFYSVYSKINDKIVSKIWNRTKNQFYGPDKEVSTILSDSLNYTSNFGMIQISGPQTF
jgi:hypothetical protein